MKINNLLINLKNPIDAFCANPRQIKRIQMALPDTHIMVTENKNDFLEKLPEAEFGLVWTFKSEWYQYAPRLKALFTPAAGNDWMSADPSGRVKTVYGSFHGRIMRESLLSMILYFNRSVAKSVDDQRNKVWGRNDYSSCVALFNQKVLIIGCGALGRSMAELLKAFGARVVGVRQKLTVAEVPNVDRMIGFDRLEEELSVADHVVLLLPGGPNTNGIITAKHFRAMKTGAFLYNLGRGSCYRNEDLLAALKNGPLAGAGLDVFDEEPLPSTSLLWEQPNVLITPHSSAISAEYLDLFIQEWIGFVSLKAT